MDTKVIIVSAVVLIFLFLVIRAVWKMKSLGNVKESDKIRILTDQNFQHQTKKGVVLIDFWAEWCMPCKVLGPVLNELAEEMDGEIAIGKVNVDEQPGISSKFGIRNIPTMVLMKDGREMQRFVGVKPKDYLAKQLRIYSK